MDLKMWEGTGSKKQGAIKQGKGIVHMYTVSVQQIACTLRDKGNKEGKEVGTDKGQ